MDFADRADLTGRLRGLVIMLDESLSAEQQRAVDELVDAGEFGEALELLADRLSEHATPIPDGVRGDFERLSAQVGNSDRVMRPLDRCPAAPDAPADDLDLFGS